MAGFSVPLSKWKEINRKIIRVKNNFFPDNPNINLKRIRRNKYDGDKSWENLSKERQDEFNSEIFNIICEKGNVIIASLIDKSKMNEKNKELSFYLSYSFIVERFQYFLEDIREEGIIIIDKAENSQEIKKLFNNHKDFLKNGVPVKGRFLKSRKEINNICENMIFLDDNDTNLLQLVDIIASAINGKYNRNGDSWFNRISSVIRKSKDGKIEGYGLKIFPP